jgi:hypothetical protein
MAQEPDPPKRFGEWEVCQKGTMINNKQGYEIEHDRLTESDWWAFFYTEPNFSWNEFIPAYFYACKMAKVEKLNLNLNLI